MASDHERSLQTSFALRMLTEEYKEGQKEFHCVFVEPERAYDRVSREELWFCMRESGLAVMTVMRRPVGLTDGFKVEVGLHQGLELSPFALVMDRQR